HVTGVQTCALPISPCSIFSTSCSSSSSDCSNWATGEASSASFFGMRQVCAVGRKGSTRRAGRQPAQGQAAFAQPVFQGARQGDVGGGQQGAGGIEQQRQVRAPLWRHPAILQQVLERVG